MRELRGVLENHRPCRVDEKKSRRGGYINIHSERRHRRRRRLDIREALSLRLPEFIREFPLSQTVINAITTAGAGGTFPSLAPSSPLHPRPFRRPRRQSTKCLEEKDRQTGIRL